MRILKIIVLLITICSLSGFQTVEGAPKVNYGACQTPNRALGKCIAIQSCTVLYNLAVKPNLKDDELKFLRNSQCGNSGKNPLVCCPNSQPTDRGELPLPPKCGHIPLTKRIMGGTATDIDEYPWTALLMYSKDNKLGLYCGGSLINDRYILTAAHCISKQMLPETTVLTGVRLGEWNQDTERDCQFDKRGNSLCASPHIDVGIEEQIIHPLYNIITQANDIALLRLAEKINFNDFIRPICLPVDTQLQLYNFENATMDITGWGATETSSSSKVKLKALVRGQNYQNCKNKYRTYTKIVLGDTQLCAGGEKNIDTCSGDSGGPLMYPKKFNQLESYFLVGVVSFGPEGCGQEGFPGIYTRVGYFMDWIQKTIIK